MKWLVWDPVFLDLNEFPAALHHFICIEGRDAQLDVGLVHPAEVLVCAEEHHISIHGPVGLGAFEALDGVVDGSVCWVDVKGFVWNNLGLLPSSIPLVVVYF